MPGATAEAVLSIKAIEPWPMATPVAVDEHADKSNVAVLSKPTKSIKAA